MTPDSQRREPSKSKPVRFAAFELDIRAGELRKNGHRIRLQEQPFRILLELLRHPGEIVLRDEIRKKLWPDETVVEFDQGINAAIKRLRDALGDSAGRSRYIETIPRRGYRFIGCLENQPDADTVDLPGVLAEEPFLDGRKPMRDGALPDEVNADPRPAVDEQIDADVETEQKVMPGRGRAFAWAAYISALVAMGALWYWRYTAPNRWISQTAVPEITRLVAEGKFASAFPALHRALEISPHDLTLKRMMRETSYGPMSVTTVPSGADVYVKPYDGPAGEWIFVGRSPVNKYELPLGNYRWKIARPGYRTLELNPGFPDGLSKVVLDREDSAPPDMVRIPSGNVSLPSAEPVPIDSFWIDKFEVTNRQYKSFVEAGGYRNQQYWRMPFIKNGSRLRWQEALAEFHDVTGRPGPSTWELGTYPAGQDNFPVGGVSWYEALAYAEFMHKQIPTTHHWLQAASKGLWSDVLQFSNFASRGAVPVGSKGGLGPFGTYDLAGNVKEWTWNETGERRYILGGGWNEASYHYSALDALPAFDRSPANGFRCAKYDAGTLPGAALRPINQPYRDLRLEKPVSDAMFAVIENFFTYDRTDLHAVRELTGDSPLWTTEKITFDAAKADQRMTAFLFLPKRGRPPYQTIVYHPASGAYLLKSLNEGEMKRFDFLLKTGHAVVLPVMPGMFGRDATPGGLSSERDVVVEDVRELRRTLDYLESRTDIDRNHLGFLGYSFGSRIGLILLAIDKRIRAGVLCEGGLEEEKKPIEIDEVTFAPRVKAPVLTINGRNDFFHPIETDQLPATRLLGTAEKDKRHVMLDAGHVLLASNEFIGETLNWFDRYLGWITPMQSQ